MKLTRDRQSNAIVNLDEDGYKQARMRKEAAKKRMRTEHEQQSLQFRIAELEKRVEKLERMLQAKTKKKMAALEAEE